MQTKPRQMKRIFCYFRSKLSRTVRLSNIDDRQHFFPCFKMPQIFEKLILMVNPFEKWFILLEMLLEASGIKCTLLCLEKLKGFRMSARFYFCEILKLKPLKCLIAWRILRVKEWFIKIKCVWFKITGCGEFLWNFFEGVDWKLLKRTTKWLLPFNKTNFTL